MKSLMWAVVFLFIVVYSLAIYFTDAVTEYRHLRHPKDGPSPELINFYGSLTVTMTSLYQSVAGGIDWNDAMTPLSSKVGKAFGIVFCLYVLFVLLAMLNIVSGIFT